MNLQYLRYALEVARTGSISKAAENLSVAQPNLSRAMKELEGDIGIAVFDRTRTGMSVTPEGEKLLAAGERILRDVADLETMFASEEAPREALTVTAPHAAYISHAFARFCRELPSDGRYDLAYREVGAAEAMGAVARGESRLGIVRYPARFESYYTGLFSEREFSAETVAELYPVIVAGVGSPLARNATVSSDALVNLCEITSPDALGTEALGTGAGDVETVPRRRLAVTERAARYDMLCADSETYMRSLPMPAEVTTRYGLLQRSLTVPGGAYRDVLIYPDHYRLTPLDKRLLAILREVAKSCNP